MNIVPLSVDEDGLRGTRPVSFHNRCLGGIPNRSAHRGEHGQPQAFAEVAIDEVKRQEPDDGNQGGDPVGVEPVERRLVPLPARNAARSDVDLRLNGPSERLLDEMQHGKEHEHDGEWPKKVEQAAAIEDGWQRGPCAAHGRPEKADHEEREESVILRRRVPRVGVGDHLHVRHRAAQRPAEAAE